MLQREWIIKPQPKASEVDELRKAINASTVLATILLQRGISDFNAAKRFFNPSVAEIPSPFLMKDMEVAVNAITDAIENGEHILVYGDYDVDGTTAVSVLYSFLVAAYPNVAYYIPDRYTEGYGISRKGIEFAEDNGISLIIALDCGIKAVDEIDFAKGKGIEFIICDHHLPPEKYPSAKAILNPLQAECSYPYKHLSGCGIGFKLIQALASTWEMDRQEPFKYLDLVGIAAACDIVSMTGENRILTHAGLRMMERALRPGLSLLLEHTGSVKDGELTKKTLTVGDLVFKIGPRINAAGRMEHGQLAVELLTASTLNTAKEAAERVNDRNTSRREVDAQILEEALAMIQEDESQQDSNATVLFADHWHKGVIGIVASRLQDHYYRPTIILTGADGKVSGSARSVPGFDIHQAIEACADLLVTYGGHPMAAGMTLNPSDVDLFKKKFEEEVTKTILPEHLIPTQEIDMVIKPSQVTKTLYQSLSRMSPFGPDNMKPVFAAHGLKDTGNSRNVGDGTHLKFEVKAQDENTVLKGIGFGFGNHLERIAAGDEFSLAFTLEENDFRGNTTIEMMVKDIKFIA